MKIGRVAVVMAIGVWIVSVSASAIEGAEPGGLTDHDRQALRRYARDTWHSFEALTHPNGLAADKLVIHDDGSAAPDRTASPTDMAAYLWSILAAERLGLIDAEESERRLDRALAAIARLKRERGFFFNWYDPATGEPVARRRPYLSTVDNGWMAAALMMVGKARPTFLERTEAILAPMDFGFFYLPFHADHPFKQPGQLRGGYFPDEGTFSPTYGMINTEPRIASYVAIARGQVPAEHYYRLYRTLPTGYAAQHKTPVGDDRFYHGVAIFEGHYEHRGMKIVPSWGGSLFEALMVPLFVPEAAWAPSSWGINHPLYAQAQIEQGLDVRRYGVWGFSPALNPSGGYQTYGVEDLGTEVEGYRTYNISGQGLKGAILDGVVTPHASFLALAFFPHEAMENLRTLEGRFRPIYSEYGFRDSVDVTTGALAEGVLAIDQGMIMAAIVNELCDNALQHFLCDGRFESTIRPLIADEHFTSAHRSR